MKQIAFIAYGLLDEGTAGIQRYTLEILRSLDQIIKNEEIVLLIPASESNDYNFKHIKVINMGISLARLKNIGIRIERYQAKNIFDFIYVRRHHAVSVDFELQFPLFGCDVIAIYDCRVNRYPENFAYSSRQRRFRRKWLSHQNRAVENCKMIIADSEFAKAEIQSCYPGIDKPNKVIYCGWQHMTGVGEEPAIIQRLGIKEREYYFSLGSRFPHKNIKWVSCAAKAHPEYTFVISGSERGNSSFEFEGEKLPNMIFAGRLSDPEVKALMRHCKAFIQPSLYEGFGIPPLEAMSVGADCIVSDIPVFREVYQDSVWYIDPLDYEHINLDQIMAQKKETNDIILESYSWEKSAEKLWEVLKEVAGG